MPIKESVIGGWQLKEADWGGDTFPTGSDSNRIGVGQEAKNLTLFQIEIRFAKIFFSQGLLISGAEQCS